MRDSLLFLLAASCMASSVRRHTRLGFQPSMPLQNRLGQPSVTLRSAASVSLPENRAMRSSRKSFIEVERVNLSTMPPKEFHQLYECDGSTPVLLSGVFQHDREKWCSGLLESLGDTEVEFQVKNAESQTDFMVGNFYEFIDGVYESSFNRSWFLFDEDILHDAAPKRLLSELNLPREYFGDDLFTLFPKALRPKGYCLIMGGEGSRSTLHADPYEWMGWNYLLEGSKLWLMIPPSPAFEAAVAGYRILPNAWDDAQYNLSAGWQSPLDLYAAAATRKLWLSARELGMMEEAERLKYLSAVGKTAAEALLDDSGAVYSDGLWGSKAAEVRQILREQQQEVFVAVQREGDLIMIPPGWWHQTYHLEPSVAVASQYTGPRHWHRVARHILDWTAAGPPYPSPGPDPARGGSLNGLGGGVVEEGGQWKGISVREEISERGGDIGEGGGEWKAKVEAVLQRGLQARHGAAAAAKMWEDLTRDAAA